MTIVAHSISVQWALEAAEKLKELHGISAEVKIANLMQNETLTHTIF